MKYIGIALGLVVIIVFASMTIIEIGHRTNRENELEVALGVAVDNSLDNLMYEKIYDIEDVDVFIADFLEDLLLQMNSDTTLNVAVKGVNIDAGMLSVEITANYTYSNGKPGSVTCERTIVFDKLTTNINEDENAKIYYSIEFYTMNSNGEYILYKTFNQEKNSYISKPATPKGNFKGWATSKNGNVIDLSSLIINKDTKLYAIYK